MKRQLVYIETTVVSYFTAKPSRDLLVAAHQEATRELWPRLVSEFDGFVSALVYEESGRGDPSQARRRREAIRMFRMLDIDVEARTLARRIIAGRGIPEAHPEDALHVAVSAVNGMDIIVTWNFAHLNNPFTRLLVRKVVEGEGYSCPEFCSPDELMEADG